MKKIVYLLILLLISIVACQKEDLGTTSIDPVQELDTLTTFDLYSSKKSVTIVGQNNPELDVPAVQNAVDNYDHIMLSGVFDFGFDNVTGGVVITKPNIVLKGPATILNGAMYENNEAVGEGIYPLSIRAPGVILWKLDFKGDHSGIYINSENHGRCVVLAGNKIDGLYTAVVVTATSGGVKILNNTLEADFGYYAMDTKGTTVIFNNDITASLDGIRMFGFDHRLYILHNKLDGIGFTAMWIGAWRVTEETGPDWGDNAPVRISRNHINIVDPYAAGIFIGSSADGINNTAVVNNTLTGVAGYGGLLKGPYGHDNVFANNDLSNLMTYSPQIWVHGGYNNQYRNNKLGSVGPFSVGDWGPALADAATLVSPINWHYKDNWLDTPDPLNYGDKFINNDYSQTGLPGWNASSEGSFGAILLLNFLERFDADFIPTDIPFVMKNYVNEHRFPNGTDVCDQVLDLSNELPNDMVPGNNHVVGWKECEANASGKSTNYSVASSKVFGQRLKDIHNRRTEALLEHRK